MNLERERFYQNDLALVLTSERAKGGAAAEGMARTDAFLAELGYA
jgi:hypothetical protein